MNALRPGPKTPDARDDPAVEFLWVPVPDADGRARIPVHVRRRAEAVGIARSLAERLKAGWLVCDR